MRKVPACDFEAGRFLLQRGFLLGRRPALLIDHRPLHLKLFRLFSSHACGRGRGALRLPSQLRLQLGHLLLARLESAFRLDAPRDLHLQRLLILPQLLHFLLQALRVLTQGRRPGKFLLKLLLRLLGAGQRLLERFDLGAKAIPLLDHRFKLQVGSNRRAPLATGHFCWRRRLLHRSFRKMHRQFTPPPERSLLDHTRVFVAAADERFDAPGQ